LRRYGRLDGSDADPPPLESRSPTTSTPPATTTTETATEHLPAAGV